MKEMLEGKKVPEWKKISVLIVALASIALAAWFGNGYFSHFITDKDYREKTAVEFENRIKLYNVEERVNEAFERERI